MSKQKQKRKLNRKGTGVVLYIRSQSSGKKFSSCRGLTSSVDIPQELHGSSDDEINYQRPLSYILTNIFWPSTCDQHLIYITRATIGINNNYHQIVLVHHIPQGSQDLAEMAFLFPASLCLAANRSRASSILDWGRSPEPSLPASCSMPLARAAHWPRRRL